MSNFTELQAVIADFNANCGDGDVLTADLNGNYISYGGQPTNVNNATTAELLIRDGTLDANAGGVNGRRILRTRTGYVTMVNVLVTGGTLGNGGALDVPTGGFLTLINTTVSGNTGTTAGGLLVKGGEATLINSTFSDNAATSGAQYAAVWADDGGIIYMANTIIANTTDGSGNDINDCLETDDSEVVFLSAGQSNLIENDWPSNSGLRCDTDGTATLSEIDPELQPLADNGGLSFTHALAASSPAINMGDNAAAIDQDGLALIADARGSGFPRINSGAVDIGSVESTVITPVITDVSIPNALAKVGDTVTATISVFPDADDYSSGSGGIAGDIAGFSVSGLSKVNDSTYTASFTIVDGGTNYAAGDSVPVTLTITNSSGIAGPTFAEPIVQNADAIYANLPEISLSASAAQMAETGGTATISAISDVMWPDAITVSLVYGGSATADDDYTGPTTLTIQAFAASSNGTLAAVSDDFYDALVDETVTIAIDSVSVGQVGAVNQESVTIVDDESAPTATLTVSAATVGEDGGTASVTVTLSEKTFADVVVSLASSGTATDTVDYATTGGDITVPAGMVTATSNAFVTAIADTFIEGDESIILDVTSVSGGGGSEDMVQQQTIQIMDADFGSLSIADVSVIEGDAGTTSATFTVTAELNGNTTAGYSVMLTTADDSATASDNDYVTNSATVNFSGTDQEMQNFVVTVNGDTQSEATEVFLVIGSNLQVGSRNITFGENLAFGTITTDETASITGAVWDDLDGNGQMDLGEPGLTGVTLFLDDGDGVNAPEEQSTTTDANGGYSFTALAAGDYQVAVDTVSLPEGYVLTGNAGSQSVSLAVDEVVENVDYFYQQQNASIGDFVWNDLNGDGVQDVGEPGLSGVTVFLDDNGNGIIDAGESSRTTENSGNFAFEMLAAGTYRVQLEISTIPAGFQLTSNENPFTIETDAGEIFLEADFGLQQQDASISGSVWNDSDGDGNFGISERGLAGVIVFVDENSNGAPDTEEAQSATASDGSYTLGNLPRGDYAVTVDETTVPAGFVLTGGSAPQFVNLTAGQVVQNVDFGYQRQDASISGQVWQDFNANGVVDMDEPGIAGLTVFLDTNSNGQIDAGEQEVDTDEFGNYQFSGLPAGSYAVTIDSASLPAGFAPIGHFGLRLVSLAEGEARSAVNFGYQAQTDLAVSITNGRNEAAPGSMLDYLVVVENNGNADVFGANLLVALPIELAQVSWICESSTGATCAASGTDFLDELLDLPAGSEAIFTVSATVDAIVGSQISVTAAVTAPIEVADLQSANNTATDATDVVIVIFRDGFEPTQKVISKLLVQEQNQTENQASHTLPFAVEAGEDWMLHLRFVPDAQERTSLLKNGAWEPGNWKPVP